MLRYKTETRPGLVNLCDIWPGNGVDLFLQPRSPHGAKKSEDIAQTTKSIARELTSYWCSKPVRVGWVKGWLVLNRTLSVN